MPADVTSRPALEHDAPFLFELFKSIRASEYAQIPLAPAQLDTLLRMQHTAQQSSYVTSYPHGDRIVLLNGTPIGRIWIFHAPGEHHLVDIGLLPEYRNRGIGAALLADAIRHARDANANLRCAVALTNSGSLRFHQRLGFQVDGNDGVYASLVLQPLAQ